jgi:hypothetical protein
MAAAHWLPKSASEDYGPSARKQVQQRSLGGGGSGCRDHLLLLCTSLQQFATIFLLVPPNFSKLPGTVELEKSSSVVPRQLAVYFEFRKPVLVQYTFS